MVRTLGGLPESVAIAWTLAFIVVVGFHCHHLIGTHGQRRAWLLVTYLAAQGTLWATNAYRGLDGRLQIGGTSAVSMGADGSFAVVAPISAPPLMSRLELRGSMITMTLGMAYMLAAMQLAAH